MGQLTLLINILGIPLLVIHIRACLNAMCAIWLPFQRATLLSLHHNTEPVGAGFHALWATSSIQVEWKMTRLVMDHFCLPWPSGWCKALQKWIWPTSMCSFLLGTHLFEILTEPSKFKVLRRQISIRITVTVAHTRFKPANAERLLKQSAMYQHTRTLQYMGLEKSLSAVDVYN